MKTTIKSFADLKNLGLETIGGTNIPFGFIVARETVDGHRELLTINSTATSPGSLGTFKEVLGIDFGDLKEGPEGNVYTFNESQIAEVLDNYFFVVKEMPEYDPTKHPNIMALEQAQKWNDGAKLAVIFYKNEDDMPK